MAFEIGCKGTLFFYICKQKAVIFNILVKISICRPLALCKINYGFLFFSRYSAHMRAASSTIFEQGRFL